MKLAKILALVLLTAFAAHAQALRATVSSDSVGLTWNASTVGANCSAPASLSYNVFRGTTAGGESTTPINSAPVTAVSYTDATVVAGTKYYYTVDAVELCASTSIASGPSNEVTVTVPLPASPPSAPTGLTGTVNSSAAAKGRAH